MSEKLEMMNIQEMLTGYVKEAVQNIYDVTLETVEFQPTRKDFEGDVTIVCFPMLRQVKTNPVKLGEDIGKYLQENVTIVSRFNVVKGFLNILLNDAYYLDFFNEIKNDPDYGFVKELEDPRKIMVEYSSPNTNKPLHLGHIRNNLLGFSVAEILEAAGNEVYRKA